MKSNHRYHPEARFAAALLIAAIMLAAVRPVFADVDEVIDGVTILISTNGTAPANNVSAFPATSANGDLIAFDSDATNLTANDTNAQADVFVRNRYTSEVELISRTPSGAVGNGESVFADISADGRYVVFESAATNLLAVADQNSARDIFVRDRQTGVTSLISKSSGGAQGDGVSENPSISENGRYVAFDSLATNLVANDTNDSQDVFVHDRQNGTTVRVSLSSGGVQGDETSWNAAISGDGEWVAFASIATTLVSGDTNGFQDIFLRDLVNNQTYRVSESTGGAQGNNDSDAPAVSADGRYVVFESRATNLDGGDAGSFSDIFLYDHQGGAVTRITEAYDGTPIDGDCHLANISDDGSLIVYDSEASVIIPGDANNHFADVFLYDVAAGETTLLSRSSGGAQGNNDSYQAAISGDGEVIAFASLASNLVFGDTNGRQDVFIHAREEYQSLFLPLVIKR